MQVTTASEKVKKRWFMRQKEEMKKLNKKKVTAWNVVGTRQTRVGIRVPPIMTSLREDGSLYQELKEKKEHEARKAVAAIVQAKSHVPSKHIEDGRREVEMEDAEASSWMCADGNAKKIKSSAEGVTWAPVEDKGITCEPKSCYCGGVPVI
jgi:hypothetical protein